jgi:hypothetical protein
MEQILECDALLEKRFHRHSDYPAGAQRQDIGAVSCFGCRLANVALESVIFAHVTSYVAQTLEIECNRLDCSF